MAGTNQNERKWLRRHKELSLSTSVSVSQAMCLSLGFLYLEEYKKKTKGSIFRKLVSVE